MKRLIIGADGSDIIDAAQKYDEEVDTPLGVVDGALSIAAGTSVEAVAGKQCGGRI